MIININGGAVQQQQPIVSPRVMIKVVYRFYSSSLQVQKEKLITFKELTSKTVQLIIQTGL